MPSLKPKGFARMQRPAQGPATIIRPRIALGAACSLGPGKIDLLRAVAEGGSISAAARSLGLSYKRAWLLIDTLNRGFGRPVVDRSVGGRGGGGARLTPLGLALLRHYDAIEAACQHAAAAELAALRKLLPATRRPPRPNPLPLPGGEGDSR
jgi:molybdate transport system regulatory protein